MKLPMQWISEYAKIEMTPQEYQDKMIMSGTGVEGTEPVSDVSGVVVGKVLTCVNMENSDHLHICTVDVGGEEPIQIVCGAPNVKEGVLVPVALPGAHLPGDIVIKKGKLRGVESDGMLCASTELGVPQELYPSVGDAGLLIFNEDYPLGSDVRPILGIDDTVVDFEILANRPDCLSVWGIARETAAALNVPFVKPEITVKETVGNVNDYVKVEVQDHDLCPRYAARVITNVRIGESPLWLRKYLHGAGMRSINNVVDITNFIMLETGHPMHAFDLEKVKNRHIIVRRAKAGETITTLDGKEYALTGSELAICDETNPTCMAGIMGGEESEITESTTSVMLECAVFDYASIRRTSRALGIRTESSGRFEKGVSVPTTVEALQRACQMFNQLDAGDVVPGIIDIYPNPKPEQAVKAKLSRIVRRTGVDIPADTAVEILQKLNFSVTRDGDDLTVIVPDYRQDVDGEADLSEEVLRMYGFDHIGCTPLRGEVLGGGLDTAHIIKNRLSALLNGQGYSEIMNYSFISRKSIERLGLPADDDRMQPLTILNPLGEDTAVMRPTLVTGMLDTLALNINRGNDAARLYEVANTFDMVHPTQEGLPTEAMALCFGAYGDGVDFYTVRDIAVTILEKFGITGAALTAGADGYYHPGRCATLNRGAMRLASIGEIHPDVAEKWGINRRVYVVEIDVALLTKLSKPMGEVVALPKFPAVSRDLALVMDDAQNVGPVMATISRAGGKLLENVKMLNIFRGVQLGEGKKSVAFSLLFRAADHTMTDVEINAAMEKILASCGKQHNAVLR